MQETARKSCCSEGEYEGESVLSARSRAFTASPSSSSSQSSCSALTPPPNITNRLSRPCKAHATSSGVRKLCRERARRGGVRGWLAGAARAGAGAHLQPLGRVFVLIRVALPKDRERLLPLRVRLRPPEDLPAQFSGFKHKGQEEERGGIECEDMHSRRHMEHRTAETRSSSAARSAAQPRLDDGRGSGNQSAAAALET